MFIVNRLHHQILEVGNSWSKLKVFECCEFIFLFFVVNLQLLKIPYSLIFFLNYIDYIINTQKFFCFNIIEIKIILIYFKLI